MRLLLDENLSPRPVPAFSLRFGHVAHVFELLGASPSDSMIWASAIRGGYPIVSKDTDFVNRSVTTASPAKVIWLRIGNCSNATNLSLVDRHDALIRAFDSVTTSSLLVLQ